MTGWKDASNSRQTAEHSSTFADDSSERCGFLEGTQVATRLGWRSVEALVPGDLVLTFDHAFKPLVDVQRGTGAAIQVCSGSRDDLLLFPEGAMGNFCDIYLLPEQGVLIESDAAEDAFGDPFVIVKAEDLVGARGIRRVKPQDEPDVVRLIFEHDEVIYAEGGILLFCGRPTVPLPELKTQEEPYKVIPSAETRALVENLVPVVQHSLPDRPITHAS